MLIGCMRRARLLLLLAAASLLCAAALSAPSAAPSSAAASAARTQGGGAHGLYRVGGGGGPVHISAEPKPATQCDPEIVQQIQRAEQEQLLKLFIALLRRVSETNDRLLVARNFEPSAASPVTAFYVEELPSEFTEIDPFVRDVSRNVGPSNLALVTTMIYVDRILKRTSTYVTSHSAHKLFVGALIVASREVDEVIIAPSLLREMTGMTELEQAQLHKAVLDAIQYKLDVTAEELMVYFDRVLFDS